MGANGQPLTKVFPHYLSHQKWYHWPSYSTHWKLLLLMRRFHYHGGKSFNKYFLHAYQRKISLWVISLWEEIEGKAGMKHRRFSWSEKLSQFAAPDPPYCSHRAKLKVTFSSNTFSLKWSNDVLSHSFSPILSQRPLSVSNLHQKRLESAPKILWTCH